MRTPPGRELEPSWAVRLGAVLRHARESAHLTLREVEARTDGQIRATAVSSYERGIRVISDERLTELAELYGVSAEDLRRRAAHQEPVQRLVIDLVALESASEPVLSHLVERLTSQRTDAVGRWLAIRRGDIHDFAQHESPEALERRLWSKGVLIPLTVAPSAVEADD